MRQTIYFTGLIVGTALFAFVGAYCTYQYQLELDYLECKNYLLFETYEEHAFFVANTYSIVYAVMAMTLLSFTYFIPGLQAWLTNPSES